MRDLRVVLVTGGAGFIGSSLVRRLLKEDDLEQLVVLDKLEEEASRENLTGPDQDPRFLLTKGDICDQALLRQLFKEHSFTAIFHLAAESPHSSPDTGTFRYTQTNVLGTANLLEVAREGKCPLLHCSTDQVYGSIKTPDKATENSPLQPSSPYAASKASADLLCRAAAITHGQDILITRCTNNYGPRQNRGNLIPTSVSHALLGKSIPIYGSGAQTRDWIHVDDHCDGLLAAWRRGKGGQIYHFAGQCERTNVGMARSVLTCLRKPHSLIENVPEPMGHDTRYALDIEKSRMWFGWQPKRRFTDTFPDVIRELTAEKQASGHEKAGVHERS